LGVTGVVGVVRHFWVFESLLDLREHALANGFVRLAAKLQETIVIAYAEIDPLDPGASGPSQPPKRG
jgi:hypothetical protein